MMTIIIVRNFPFCKNVNVLKLTVAFLISLLITDTPKRKPQLFPIGRGLPPRHIEPSEGKQSVSESAGI